MSYGPCNQILPENYSRTYISQTRGKRRSHIVWIQKWLWDQRNNLFRNRKTAVNIERGVRQGCVLFPLSLLRQFTDDLDKVDGGILINGVALFKCAVLDHKEDTNDKLEWCIIECGR